MTAGYRTRFTPAAARAMKAIPLVHARTILLRLGAFQKAVAAGDTSAFDIKAMRGHAALYRLRVGDFRIVYSIDTGELVIWVVAVGDRRDIYRHI